MFNSLKCSESSRTPKSSLLSWSESDLNDTITSAIAPRITSTPLTGFFATPPRSRVLSSRHRYSLSEIATPPRNSRRGLIRSNSQNHLPVPLLTSTKYNLNVSTFEDVKSPGLANRIVQYNEESEKAKERHATHQPKYGSVGLFPVVHLFKKKLPVLEQKSRHVTVRFANPDHFKHTPEYNKKLLEGIVKPSGTKHVGLNSTLENSNSTRSVLDALKEISRKRIHANEEIESNEDTGKRLRTDDTDCTDSNKRLRDESPLLESTSPSRQLSKKICMYDEYAASRSSMDLLKKTIYTVPKRKSISISTLTENPKETKQVKVLNAETQTLPVEESNKLPVEETTAVNIDSEKNKKVETVLKVFDDAPLERIRKNRLAALIGTLVGKDPILEPKPTYSSLLRDETDKAPTETSDDTDKQIVSILSTPNKSPNKTSKHVHFNIPETSSDAEPTPVSTTTSIFPVSTPVISSENKEISTNSSLEKNSNVTVTTATSLGFSFGNVSTPSVSNEKSIPVTQTANLPSLFPNKPATEKISSNFATTNAAPTGGFKFDLSKNEPSTTSTLTTKTPTLSFGSPSPKPTSSLASTTASQITANIEKPAFPKTTSPLNIGGKPTFSFDQSSTAKTAMSFRFPAQTAPTVTSVSPSTASSVSNSTNSIGAFASAPTTSNSGSVGTLGNSVSSNNGFSIVTTSAKTSFSTITSVANKGLITSPSITNTFGGTSSPSLSTFGSSFNSPTVNTFGPTATNKVNTFGMGSTPTTGGFTSNSSTSVAQEFTAATTSNSGFGNSSTFGPSTTSSFVKQPGFGASVTSNFGTSTASVFNTPTTTPVGFSTTTSSAFGSTPAIGFGNNPNSDFGTSSPGFATMTTASNNIFGTPSTKSGFGSVGTKNVITKTNTVSPFPSVPSGTNTGFGNTIVLNNPFGNTSVGGFGVTTATTTTNASSFATTTASTVFSFGGNNTASSGNAFGAPSSSVGFGASTNFGANAGPLFGNTNAPSFGSSTTVSFGSSTGSSSSFSDPAFAVPTTNTPAFGSTTPLTSSSFIDGTNKIFGGTASNFGTPSTTTTSIFGSTANPFGGASNVTTASQVLPFTFTGKTTANSFGSTNTTTSSFGGGFGQTFSGFNNNQSTNLSTTSKTPLFGNSNVSSFGGTTTNPGFGTSQPQQPFGTAGSLFNKPQSAPNSFGSPQFSFNQPQQQNNANTFGATTNNAPVFAFGGGGGAVSNIEKPGGFNFSNAAASVASGETRKTFDFTSGSTATPVFGSTAPVPTFGATNPSVGGFSIGTAPPPAPKQRHVIKGKRRT